jgi:hypothetical protein
VSCGIETVDLTTTLADNALPPRRDKAMETGP